jgi:hypothetical protein
VLGWSGLRSTLALMPTALLMMFASGLAPRVAARIGGRSTMAAGIVLGAAGLALMAGLVSVDGGYLSVLPGMLAMGLGMGSLHRSHHQRPAACTSGRGVRAERRHQGTGHRARRRAARNGPGRRLPQRHRLRLDGVPADVADTARHGIANAVAAGARSQALIHAAQQSFVNGWQQAMWVGAGVMAVVLVYVLV